MSSIEVTTIKNASGGDSVAQSALFNGTAKALGNIAENGTLTDDYNISSVTDTGTGNRDSVSFSASFDASDWYWLSGNDDDGVSGSCVQADITNGSKAAGSFDFEIYTVNQTTGRTNFDAESYFASHGDLA